MTELEAVNIMLRAIGEMPVSSVEENVLEDYPEAQLAYQKLYEVSRQIQSIGLDCNTEERYPLTPDVNDNIILPANTMQVEAHDKSNYIMRGNKLYNKDTYTYVFSDTVEVDLIMFLEFDELPQHVRDYIVVVAKKEFQTVLLGAESLDAQLEENLKRTRATFHMNEKGLKKVIQVSRSIQAKGLDCNMDFKYVMTPDTNNEIIIPSNVLFIEASSPKAQYVVRDGKLYDKDNQTYLFSSPVEVDVTWLLKYKELPQHVRDYVDIAGKKLYLSETLGPLKDQEGNPLYNIDFDQLENQAYMRMYKQEKGMKKVIEVSRAIQTAGLDCNTDEGWSITPDAFGEIILPTNTLFAEPEDIGLPYVLRGLRLYNKDTQSYTFTTSVKLNVTWMLAYDELPQHVRDYIEAEAKKRFHVDVFGEAERDIDEVIRNAKVRMHRGEINSDRRTMLDNPATYNVVRRYW